MESWRSKKVWNGGCRKGTVIEFDDELRYHFVKVGLQVRPATQGRTRDLLVLMECHTFSLHVPESSNAVRRDFL